MKDLLETKHAGMEIMTYSDPLFPILELVDHFDSFANRSFPSHWHQEMEFHIILRGSAEYRVNGISYKVQEGSGIYIAPEAVHMIKALSDRTVSYNLILLPQFLSNLLKNIHCEKYIHPFTSRVPDAYLITPKHKESHAILEAMKRMYYTENTHFAYELFLLEKILGIWRNLLPLLPNAANDLEETRKGLRIQRMRAMLGYIRHNYTQPISVEDIAASANIGKSECFRCFSELSKTTPMEYVTRIRLMQAAQMLITSNNSISEICFSTGFNNTSYFSKRFHTEYNLTPKAYRAKNRAL